MIFNKYLKLQNQSLTKMNFYPNAYFPIYYQPTYEENEYQYIPEAFPCDQEAKYLKIVESQNRLLKEKVQVLQEKLKGYEEIEREQQNMSRRRKISDKQKMTFQCPYPNCKRNYKSTLALNLHIKMKHNGGSIRQREAYAKLIFQCQRDNKPKPEININFPPNFLENYRKKMIEAQNMMKENSV